MRIRALPALAVLAATAAYPVAAASAGARSQAASCSSAPVASPQDPHPSPWFGQMWVVDPQNIAEHIPNPPDPVPDDTFCAPDVAFIGRWSGPGTRSQAGAHCFTVATFLTGCQTYGYEVKYSHKPDRLLGGQKLTGATPLANSAYGTLIKLTNRDVCLPRTIHVIHDGAIRVKVDGFVLRGFDPSNAGPALQTARWSGPRCGNTVQIWYADASVNPLGDPSVRAWLLFVPRLS